MQKASSSCSNISDEATQVEGGHTVRSLSLDQPSDMLTELGSATPEDLRQQALSEKQKYKTLKAQGKSEEALKAFKRGKELERQAGALELSLRKNRKRALSVSSSTVDDTQQIKEELKSSSRKMNPPSQKGKEPDDLSAELRELGWSDLDLHAAEKKPATLSLEGELSSLLREVSQKSNKETRAVTTDKSEVIALKKKALEMKRAGYLVGAKEELKKAKVLERKIEEEELLGESDESDDELSSLIRSMDSVEHDDISARKKSNLDFDFDFNRIIDMGDDIGNFDITDEDMDDPEISSALKSLGWEEEEDTQSEGFDSQAKRESYVAEIQSLKREALNQKRAGNTGEALALLKKAKLLEAELESSNVQKKVPVLETVKETPKSKLVIQKELIALKKKALSLRREGKVDESDEELRKAKVLEEQLEDMNKVAQPVISSTYATQDNVEEEEVTDQDLNDPAYLSLLKNMGWEEGDKAEAQTNLKESQSYVTDSSTVRSVGTSKKSKSEIQRELLTLKRKALTLRRQGEAEEADEVLQMARSLEAQLEEFDEPIRSNDAPEITKLSLQVDPHENIAKDSEVQVKDEIGVEKPEEKATVSQPLQQEILAHKRRAVAFKRDGKMSEAKEELRKAKLLEKQMEETSQTTSDASASVSASSVSDKEASPSSVSKPPSMSSRDRFKLQQKSLGHKREALKLRREGRTAEADAEFELAKAIESQLQELDTPGSSGPVDDVNVEDFLDPQLLAALQLIGLGDSQPKSEIPESTDVNTDREQLLEQIRTEKVKAVNLKRAGKQGEALDALRRAKLYEKKLQSLS